MDSQDDVATQQPGFTPSEPFRDDIGEFVTSDAASLKQALINEKAAPELLQYAEGLVSRVESRFVDQEALLQEWEGGSDKGFAASIVQYDLHRVKYLLRGYLRVRLRKLEQHIMAILDDDEALRRLSPKERAYANQYFRLFGLQMKDSLLQHLPKNFDSMVKESSANEEKNMVDGPDLDRYVFCRVLEDCGTINLDDAGDGTAEFNKGDLYVVRYRVVRNLLADHAVELV